MEENNSQYFVSYPPPTMEIINRIARILSVEPQFYIKVVQLMETMNLPSPFNSPNSVDVHFDNLDETDDVPTQSSPTDFLPSFLDEKERKKMKSYLDQTSRRGCVQKSTKQIQNISFKKPKLKIVTRQKDVNSKDDDLVLGEFGRFYPTVSNQPSEQLTEEFDFDSAYSLEFIRTRRMSSDDMKRQSVFKHYHADHQSASRLYVKNISKKTTENELKQVFAAFLDPGNEEIRQQFDVRLMKTGKLRGQAFVSMGSISNAEKAVKETNGFILHSKPIVVSFARSRPAAEES